MPIYALWALVVSLAVLALGMAYKIAEISHGRDRSNDEALSLKSEIDTLKKTHDKEISNIKELHKRKVEELTKEIDRLTQENISKPNKDNSLDILSDKDIEILRLIAEKEYAFSKRGSSIDEFRLCAETGLSDQIFRLHLDHLRSAGCIYIDPRNELRGITPKGRELLHQKGLLP